MCLILQIIDLCSLKVRVLQRVVFRSYKSLIQYYASSVLRRRTSIYVKIASPVFEDVIFAPFWLMFAECCYKLRDNMGVNQRALPEFWWRYRRQNDNRVNFLVHELRSVTHVRIIRSKMEKEVELLTKINWFLFS